MIGPTTILIAVIVISMALIAFLVIRPSVTGTRGGKILAFISLFIFPILAGSMGAAEHVEHSKTTEFCLSCHVMTDYGQSLRVGDKGSIPAVHFQNHLVPPDQACYTCHTDYAMYGDVRAKLRGLRHVYVQYAGKVPETVKLYTPYNNRECLHCHLGAKSFEEGVVHNQDPETLPKIKSNQLSCTTSGCHEVVHNVKSLREATRLKEVAK